MKDYFKELNIESFNLLCFEDLKNKHWHFIERGTSKIHSVPFGSIAIDFINNMPSGKLKADLIDFLRGYKKRKTSPSFLSVNLEFWKANRLVFLSPTNIDFEDFTKQYCKYIDVHCLEFNGSSLACDVYALEGTNGYLNMFPCDFYHLIVGNNAFTPIVCSHCGKVKITKRINTEFCNQCQDIRQKNNNLNRKYNTCRYLHKKITDKLNYNGSSVDFRKESNYYWSIVNGKNTEVKKEYSRDIRTESDYLDWLKTYLEK